MKDLELNEHDYYNDLANWSFDDIDMVSETITNWIYEDVIAEHATKDSKILDLGTAAGEKVLKRFPECAEILGTDYSEAMIENANKNLKKYDKPYVHFKVMDNLHMDVPDEYYDIVTARHTVTAPDQIYKALKKGGYLILRGVDKMDCWELKRMFGRGQGFVDKKPISVADYEAVLDAGFKEVELIPLHVVEYYKTAKDLYALLVKVPILDDFSEFGGGYEKVPIEQDVFEKYVSENTTEKGIKLIRRYYGIIAKKL